jgi:hypothetical protein
VNTLLIIIGIFIAGSSWATEASDAAPRVYQMDLFSLISFALAIAALVLSIFMGWLSWEFYKKSSEASDKTQQAVVKIETAVLSIQSEITEIVRRAIGYWTNGGASDEAGNQNAELAAKVDELSSQIQSVAGNAANKHELEEKLAELVQLQNDRISSLSASVLEAKAKAFFPSIDKGPVAQVTQSIKTNSEREKSGELIIDVLRPSKIATATGKFSPSFSSLPQLEVALISAPFTDLSHVTVTSGVGKTNDFNVHLIGRSGLLEAGAYVVNYKATAIAENCAA